MEEWSLPEILRETRDAFERQGQALANAAIDLTSFDKFGDILTKHFLDVLTKSNSKPWGWLGKHLGWVYSGLHISVTAVSLIASRPEDPGIVDSGRFSLTFNPSSGRRDQNQHYFREGMNFTTFLWPADPLLRGIIASPLEIIICKNSADDRTFRTPDYHHRAIVVPSSCATQIREALINVGHGGIGNLLCGKESKKLASQMRQYLRKIYFRRDVSPILRKRLQEYLDSEVTDEACLRRLVNTIQLHITVSIEPRTVVFFPVTLFGERQGVVCFVLNEALTYDDKITLKLLCDFALLALRQPDREVARFLEAQAERVRLMEAASVLIHPLDGLVYCAGLELQAIRNEAALIPDSDRSQILTSSDKISSFLYQIQDQYKQFVDQLARPEDFKVVEIGEIVRGALEELAAQHGPALPSLVDISDWKSSLLRIRAVPSRLRAAISEVVWNGIKAAKRQHLSSEEKLVEISFGSEYDWATIIVRDKGPGIEPTLLERMLKNMQSFERIDRLEGNGSGFGLTSAYWTISRLHRGRMFPQRPPSGGGMAWKISLQST